MAKDKFEQNEELVPAYTDTTQTIQAALKKVDFDLAIDFAEIGLDTFLSDDLLKEIPVVKSIVGLTKGALQVREIYFAKKLMVFLSQFHAGELPRIKMIEFQDKFENNSRFKERVLDQIMVYNDRFLEINKSKIYANLFLAHLNGKYEYEDLISLLNCLEKLNLTAVDFLHEMAKETKPFYREYSQFDDNVALLIAAGFAQQWGTHLQITAHGIYIYFFGILGDVNYSMHPDKI